MAKGEFPFSRSHALIAGGLALVVLVAGIVLLKTDKTAQTVAGCENAVSFYFAEDTEMFNAVQQIREDDRISGLKIESQDQVMERLREDFVAFPMFMDARHMPPLTQDDFAAAIHVTTADGVEREQFAKDVRPGFDAVSTTVSATCERTPLPACQETINLYVPTNADMRSAVKRLSSDDRVKDVRTRTKAATLTEFTELFIELPEGLETASMDAVPALVKVTPEAGTDVTTLADDFRASIPRVHEIRIAACPPPRTIEQARPSSLPCGGQVVVAFSSERSMASAERVLAKDDLVGGPEYSTSWDGRGYAIQLTVGADVDVHDFADEMASALPGATKASPRECIVLPHPVIR